MRRAVAAIAEVLSEMQVRRIAPKADTPPTAERVTV
jgi:hypothetical protein